jgi:hypothetical protein
MCCYISTKNKDNNPLCTGMVGVRTSSLSGSGFNSETIFFLSYLNRCSRVVIIFLSRVDGIVLVTGNVIALYRQRIQKTHLICFSLTMSFH